jgi:oligopeptide transport system substrate-binding protein
MNNATRLFILVSLLIALVTACDGKRKTLVQIGDEKQILHVASPDEIADLDPHTTTGSVEHNIQTSVFEGLVTQDPQTLEPKPGVADSWTVSEDGKVYKFHIRDNARWSNGDKFVANDFVESWHRALLPNLANQWASYLFVIKNAEAFYTGQIKDFTEVGVKALSDQELEITLANNTPYFLQLLNHNSMYPVHIKTIQKYGALDERSTLWTRAGNFVSNGPFMLTEWTPQKVVTVVRNPHYWDAANVRLNQINFYPIQSDVNAERNYRAGQVHLFDKLPKEKIAYYRDKKDPAHRTFPMYGTYFYRFNTTVKPLDDVRVRRALAFALDRETIVKNVTKGGEVAAYTLTPPNPYGYTAEARVPYDPELAKKLLAEAGYPNGVGFPKLKLLYNTLESHQKIAVAIQALWKQTLGIDIELENQEWKTFLENQRTMNYQICRASWIGDYIDPDTFLQLFITDGGNNETGWSNARYDQLIRDAAAATDQQARFQIFQEAEKILDDEVPIIPIYTYVGNRLVSPSVKGWKNHLQDFWTYKDLYLEPQVAN